MLSANRLSNGHLRPATLASLAMSKEGNAVIQLVGRWNDPNAWRARRTAIKRNGAQAHLKIYWSQWNSKSCSDRSNIWTLGGSLEKFQKIFLFPEILCLLWKQSEFPMVALLRPCFSLNFWNFIIFPKFGGVAVSWLYHRDVGSIFSIFPKFPIFPKFGGRGSMVALSWLYFYDFSDFF